MSGNTYRGITPEDHLLPLRLGQIVPLEYRKPVYAGSRREYHLGSVANILCIYHSLTGEVVWLPPQYSAPKSDGATIILSRCGDYVLGQRPGGDFEIWNEETGATIWWAEGQFEEAYKIRAWREFERLNGMRRGSIHLETLMDDDALPTCN